ncbi:hypothetical protein Tco_1352032 [Tanacetum coccineum]
MAANRKGDDGPPPAGGGDLPLPDLRTMEELCQPTLNGRGGPISMIAIQETNFRLKNDMIQQVQNSCRFRRPGDDANKHLDKFLHVTQSMNVNGVSDDALRLILFPYSWQHRVPIANHTPAPGPAYQAPPYQAPVHQVPIPQPQVVTNAEFSSYMKANDAILKNMQTNITTLISSTNDLKNMLGQFMKMNNASTSGSGTLPSNTVTNPREDLKGITTQSGVAYNGPTILTTSSPPKVVERKTEETKDTVPPTNNGSTEDVQPPVVQVETHVPISEHVKAPVSAPKPNPKPSIPYPSRLKDKKLREKANNQMEKFYQIFSRFAFRH